MHEANFTKQIVDSVLSELEKHPELKPARVKIKVGAMLHLNSESVKMHYSLLTQGTGLEGIALDFEEVGVEVYCRDCNHVGPVADHHILLCSLCDSLKVELIKGNEILVESIEAET